MQLNHSTGKQFMDVYDPLTGAPDLNAATYTDEGGNQYCLFFI